MFGYMQDDEEEAPEPRDEQEIRKRSEGGQFVSRVSKSSLISAIDEYITGKPTREVCGKYGIPHTTFRRALRRAGVRAHGNQVSHEKIARWRECYKALGTIHAVIQEVGGDYSTIRKALGKTFLEDYGQTPSQAKKSVQEPPKPRKDGLLPEPKSLTPFHRHRIRHLRSEVQSEVPWVFPGCERAIQRLQENDDVWWWQRLKWTIGEWYQCSQTQP